MAFVYHPHPGACFGASSGSRPQPHPHPHPQAALVTSHYSTYWGANLNTRLASAPKANGCRLVMKTETGEGNHEGEGAARWKCRAEWRREAILKSFNKGMLACALAAAMMLNTATVLDWPVLNHIFPDSSAALAAQSLKGADSTQVIKDPESLLRWALPIDNKYVRELQIDLEAMTKEVKVLNWPKVSEYVKKAQGVIRSKKEQILASVPSGSVDEARTLLNWVDQACPTLISYIGERDPEKVINLQLESLRKVGDIEQLMVTDFPYKIPSEYDNLPQLKGRATVAIVLKRAGNTPFNVDGTLYDKLNLKMVIDGYSAPITGGAFVDLVQKGFYNGLEINRSDGFVIQTGKVADSEGYVDPATKKIRTIPLEVFVASDKAPTYGITTEDDGRGNAKTKLPFSAYGTVAFAREEFTPDSGSSQFFWFLFEPDLTPAGRNLLDGRYAVFGYTTEGEFLLKDVKVGDFIESMKVLSGEENLVLPK